MSEVKRKRRPKSILPPEMPAEAERQEKIKRLEREVKRKLKRSPQIRDILKQLNDQAR